jgi:hypothetical protein
LEGIKGLGVETRPVGDAAEEGAGVDQVEAVFAEEPWLGEVVDFEAQVWGDERGLCGAEIGAENLGVLGGCRTWCG